MSHAIIENALPDWMRQAALASFPLPDWQYWHRYPSGKSATVDACRLPRACLAALDCLALTVPPIDGFWDYDLHGAGLHEMPPGVALGNHVDATHHPVRPWRRVGSLVFWLNDCNGGELIVSGEKITPKAGLAALFRADQPHEVLTTHTSRKTLSLFCWTLDAGPKSRTAALFSETPATT